METVAVAPVSIIIVGAPSNYVSTTLWSVVYKGMREVELWYVYTYIQETEMGMCICMGIIHVFNTK